ncbi:MAG: hypothetical protein GQ542_17590 [Desulforhopalus sp.]|nr:hypothetical protein [Desulforhopalus sp.]
MLTALFGIMSGQVSRTLGSEGTRVPLASRTADERMTAGRCIEDRRGVPARGYCLDPADAEAIAL